jgi:hypothetical protein
VGLVAEKQRGRAKFTDADRRRIADWSRDTYPDMPREELAEKIQTKIFKGRTPPSFDYLLKLISEYRNLPDSPEDAPWSTATLKDHPIPPEAIPVVLEIWKNRQDKKLPFTIRDAKWTSQLSATEVPPQLQKTWSKISWLDYVVSLYAMTERISEITKTAFDPGGLDRVLVGIPTKLRYELEKGKETGRSKVKGKMLYSWKEIES